MTTSTFEQWMLRYGKAWEAGSPEDALSLFSADAQYFETPFDPPMVGHEAIRQYWTEGAKNAQRHVRFEAHAIAFDGKTGSRIGTPPSRGFHPALASSSTACSRRSSTRRCGASSSGSGGTADRRREVQATPAHDIPRQPCGAADYAPDLSLQPICQGGPCPTSRTGELKRQASPSRDVLMATDNAASEGQFVHVVTLDCKDSEHAKRCIEVLAVRGKPDALAFNCISYEFGVEDGAADKVYIVERWRRWQDLDALLVAKVVPALPAYNQLLKTPFDPSRDTVRINLSGL